LCTTLHTKFLSFPKDGKKSTKRGVKSDAYLLLQTLSWKNFHNKRTYVVNTRRMYSSFSSCTCKVCHPLLFSQVGWLCGHHLPLHKLPALDTEKNLICCCFENPLSTSLDLICHSHPQQSVMRDTCDLLWLPEVLPHEIVGVVNYYFLHQTSIFLCHHISFS